VGLRKRHVKYETVDPPQRDITVCHAEAPTSQLVNTMQCQNAEELLLASWGASQSRKGAGQHIVSLSAAADLLFQDVFSFCCLTSVVAK